MGRFNRGIQSRGRNHHGVQAGLHSLFFDGQTDYVGFRDYDPTDHASSISNGANTSLLWRLPGTLHKNNNNMNHDWTAEQGLSNFGETEISVAFWVKLYPGPDASKSFMPYAHASQFANGFKTIWASSREPTAGPQAGIFVGVGYEPDGPQTGNANYFMMGKGGGVSGTSGRSYRTGTTTPIFELANAGNGQGGNGSSDYFQPQWFHIACVWNHCDPQSGGWEMWVNGVKQVNLFNSSNGFYQAGELHQNAYMPLSISPATTEIGTFARHGSSYFEQNITDFGYWHAALDDNDVSALWNNGVLSNRVAPTADFSSTW